MEILADIVLRLSIVDRQNFGATSRLHRTIVGGVLMRIAGESLRPFNVSLQDVRFLQSCKSTIISGPTVRRLFYLGPDLRKDAEDRRPAKSLDFYCATGEQYFVASFLKHATGYDYPHYNVEIAPGSGIRHASRLIKPNCPDINIFETHSTNPLDAILHLPTTADICAWTLDRIWHGYPAITVRGHTVTTPTRLPANDVRQRQRCWDVIQRSLQDGFHIHTEWERRHVCGHDSSCPSTHRTTDDKGCLTALFPSIPYRSTTTRTAWDLTQGISWSMGNGPSCRKGTTFWGRPIKPYTRYEGGI